MIPVNYQLIRTVGTNSNAFNNIVLVQNRLSASGYSVSVSRRIPDGSLVILFSGFPEYFRTSLPDGNDWYAQAVLDTDSAVIFANNNGTFPASNTSNNTNSGGGWFDVTQYTSGNTYVVKSGDTLSKIGAKLGISWQTIAALNNIKSPYVIRIGQTLKTGAGGNSQPQQQPQQQPPVILQPSNLPPVLTNNNNAPQPQPQPQKKNPLDSFFDTTSGKLTGIGIAALILIGGIVLTGKK